MEFQINVIPTLISAQRGGYKAHLQLRKLQHDLKSLPCKYFVLNASLKEMFNPVIQNRIYFNLVNDGKALADRQIIILDENAKNKHLAEVLKGANRYYFEYEVWQTDHPFTNKRISLINKVLAFLNRNN